MTAPWRVRAADRHNSKGRDGRSGRARRPPIRPRRLRRSSAGTSSIGATTTNPCRSAHADQGDREEQQLRSAPGAVGAEIAETPRFVDSSSDAVLDPFDACERRSAKPDSAARGLQKRHALDVADHLEQADGTPGELRSQTACRALRTRLRTSVRSGCWVRRRWTFARRADVSQ